MPNTLYSRTRRSTITAYSFTAEVLEGRTLLSGDILPTFTLPPHVAHAPTYAAPSGPQLVQPAPDRPIALSAQQESFAGFDPDTGLATHPDPTGGRNFTFILSAPIDWRIEIIIIFSNSDFRPPNPYSPTLPRADGATVYTIPNITGKTVTYEILLPTLGATESSSPTARMR